MQKVVGSNPISRLTSNLLHLGHLALAGGNQTTLAYRLLLGTGSQNDADARGLAAISADSTSLSASGGATVGQPKAELHQMVDRPPDQAVDGAATLLGEMTEGRIDPEQAWSVLCSTQMGARSALESDSGSWSYQGAGDQPPDLLICSESVRSVPFSGPEPVAHFTAWVEVVDVLVIV